MVAIDLVVFLLQAIAFLCISTIAICRIYSWIYLRYFVSLRTVGFFHPFCNSGGGGERVLWLSILSLEQLSLSSPLHCLIYSGDTNVESREILNRAHRQFNVEFHQPISFVFVRSRFLVNASSWPRFTLLGQSLGSILLAFESLLRSPCHVFFDSTGYAFSYLIAKIWFGCTVVSYTHYPQISTDMLQRVQERRPTYNNDIRISRSTAASIVKLIYYKAFAKLYGFAGRFADLVMVNSTWTQRHINEIFKIPASTFLVYPPCPVTHLVTPTSLLTVRRPIVISVSQFRQEKDHELQIKSFALFLKSDFISQRRYSSSVVADLLPNSNIGRRGGGVDFSLPLSTSFDGRPKLILSEAAEIPTMNPELRN
jgi:alpha-1,2-mannosyltransferase